MRGRRLFLPVLATLALAIAAPPARGEDFYSQEKCSLCHIRESVFFSPDFAAPETLKGFGEERVCFSCHNGTVRDSRDVLWRGAQHPSAGRRDGSGRKRCSSCHSPHGKGGWGVLAGTSIPIRKGGDALCTGCHAGYDRDKRAIHRTGFPEGGCGECHRAHGGTGNTLLREARRTLCLRCHPGVGTEKSGGHRVARAGSAAKGAKPFPECVACHPVHGKDAPEGGVDAQCAGCHAFRKGAGASGQKGHRGEANCTECHSFHEKSGANGRGLRRGDIRPALLCGRCHAARVADERRRAREKGTHPTGSGTDLCLRCHRIHSGTPGTALLVTGKSYSCLECHEAQNTISEVAGIVLAHPVFERLSKGRLAAAAASRRLTLGPGGEIVCRTCHAVHGAAPDTPLLARQMSGEGSCGFCHEAMEGRSHRLSGKETVGPDCGTCHPVHGKRQPRGGDGGGTVDAWAALCTTCHPRDGSHVPAASAGGGGRTPDMPGFDARGRAVRTGTVSCPTCHEPHGAKRNKRLRRDYEPSGFLCTACHRDKESVALTPHDLRGISGRSACEPCHRPHGGKGRWMWGVASVAGDNAAGECRSCHREQGRARAVPAGGHPVNILVPRPVPDTFPLFGVSGVQAKNGLLTCATCHEVHGLGILPLGQEGTGLLLRARTGQAADDIGRVRACLPCHQGKQAMHGQADCIWCHPPHDAANAGPDCRNCHTMGGTGVAQTHGDKLRGCGTCHRIHGEPEGSPGARPCLGCHPKSGTIAGTSHGEMQGGPCRTCHPAHETVAEKPVRRHGWEELFVPDIPCLRCHRENGEGPVVAGGDHPKSRKTVPTSYGAVVTLETPIVMVGRLQEGGVPLFPLFDESGQKGLSGRMGCLTCHDPHAGNTMKSGEKGGAAVRYLRDPSGVFLAEVCAPCHKDSAVEHARKFHDLVRKAE